jgi:acetyl-CoA carboxylase carboxyl transferase subunit alpha
MMENAVYSVISPEGCASIMWRDASKRQLAAAALKITAPDVIGLGCADDMVPEPAGGAQYDPVSAFGSLGEKLKWHLDELLAMPAEARMAARYAKFRNMAQFYTQ